MTHVRQPERRIVECAIASPSMLLFRRGSFIPCSIDRHQAVSAQESKSRVALPRWILTIG